MATAVNDTTPPQPPTNIEIGTGTATGKRGYKYKLAQVDEGEVKRLAKRPPRRYTRVPDEAKTQEYLARRRSNNESVRNSRIRIKLVEQQQRTERERLESLLRTANARCTQLEADVKQRDGIIEKLRAEVDKLRSDKEQSGAEFQSIVLQNILHVFNPPAFDALQQLGKLV